MLEIWGMWRILSLPLLPRPLCPGVVAPERVLSKGQIELFDIQTVCKQICSEVVMVTNLTGLWDGKLTWYSPRATHWICLYGFDGPVGWGCRIHRLLLCSGKPPPHWVSSIWLKTIWWWGFSKAGALKNVVYPFIAIAPRSTLVIVVIPDRVISVDQTELNCVLMLNWIDWNRTILACNCV